MRDASQRHRRHHHEGFGPWGGRHWDRMWFGGPWGGRRARRGDVRTGLLSLLADKPMHGYDLIRELEQRSGGMWRPSPGSVYPSLQQLADEGLVTSTEVDSKRTYEITDEGRALAEERIAAAGYPWDAMDEGRGDQGGLRSAVKELAVVAKLVGMNGSPEMIERASDILVKARKDLYGLLAEG